MCTLKLPCKSLPAHSQCQHQMRVLALGRGRAWRARAASLRLALQALPCFHWLINLMFAMLSANSSGDITAACCETQVPLQSCVAYMTATRNHDMGSQLPTGNLPCECHNTLLITEVFLPSSDLKIHAQVSGTNSPCALRIIASRHQHDHHITIVIKTCATHRNMGWDAKAMISRQCSEKSTWQVCNVR